MQDYIKRGAIVPVEITVALLLKKMNASPKRKFLIDGFPRNANNLQGWYDVVGDSANVEGVLFFDCSEETLTKRLLGRAEAVSCFVVVVVVVVHLCFISLGIVTWCFFFSFFLFLSSLLRSLSCGLTLTLSSCALLSHSLTLSFFLNSLHKQPQAGANRRADDNIESIQKRFRTYATETRPIIDTYANMGKVMTIDANNGTIDEIFNTVKPIIEKIDEKLKKKDDVVHLCNSYRVDSRPQLEEYFQVHAARLRGDGLKAYGGKFTVDRRIMKSEHIAHRLHHV